MIAPARVAAFDVLRKVATGREDLPHALARVRSTLPDERDRGLAAEIATGTLRWQGAFDRIVAEFTGRALDRLDPDVLDILRLTMFQLLHLDRVPASAAVNDAVSLTRRAGKRSAAPLVNAVLRRVGRERDRLPLPALPGPGATRESVEDYLATTLSHPAWLAGRWLERYGAGAAEHWMRFNNAPAPLTLRVNRLKTTAGALTAALGAHGVDVEPGRFGPDALIVRQGNPLQTPLWGDGQFVVQDEASQLVALFAAARPGERVLDACAAPGGKTTAMAADMADSGLLVAGDVRPRRIELLARTAASSGAHVIRIVQADAEQPLPFTPVFDLVLLDAPCSGLGIVRRDPDVKWRRREADLAAFTEVQCRMLHRAADALVPGGRLVYSTCSSEPEENERVIDTVLAERRDLRAGGPPPLPPEVEGLVDGLGRLRTLPFRDGLEAFFAASVVKRADSQ